MDKKYKIVLPVGDNCEIGAHLVRNGYQRASLLRFSQNQMKDVLNLFENDFKDVFVNIHPFNSKLMNCNKYGIKWHTRLIIEKNDKTGKYVLSKSNFDLKNGRYDLEVAKIHYLTYKMKEDLNSNAEILFMYKSNIGDFSLIPSFIKLISTKYPKLMFKFLLVKTPEQEIQLQEEKLIIEEVEYLAPSNVAIKGGDDRRFKKIIEKYIHINPFMNLSTEYHQQPADLLRKVAICFEQTGDIKTAKTVMGKALELRPEGPVIKDRLERYNKELHPKSKIVTILRQKARNILNYIQ